MYCAPLRRNILVDEVPENADRGKWYRQRRPLSVWFGPVHAQRGGQMALALRPEAPSAKLNTSRQCNCDDRSQDHAIRRVVLAHPHGPLLRSPLRGSRNEVPRLCHS